ncbi:hypothetical protein [Arthrobacter sp. Br18]|uniref:hypothetical protein n=1 Tax=Arthrobacter sp. Br18 TaxID=1312954 RepID=UPI00047CA76F|nr:hypothetical protein [Arthrobacter sp. Br18]
MAVTISGFSPTAGTPLAVQSSRTVLRRWSTLIVVALVLMMTGPVPVLGTHIGAGPGSLFQLPSASASFSATGTGVGSVRTGTLAPPLPF